MQRKLDFKWLATGGVVLVILILTAVLNTNHIDTSGNKISGTIATDNGDLKINWNNYGTYSYNLDETSDLTIAKSGTYTLTGTLADGAVVIKTNDDDVKLILDNVTIKNSTGPAIACYNADDLVIELVGENYLSDGSAYASDYDDDVTGAIYTKSDLTFQGDGTLNLTANYQDGIVSKDDLKFISGTYNIKATDDAIRGKDSVYIVGGDFTIDATADAIKSTNETDAGKGFVLIENGTLAISAGKQGIEAINNVLIYDGKINIQKSFEGIEAESIVINGGEISIIASDDGLNAGGGADASATTSANNARPGAAAFDANPNCILTINGGNLYINAAGDGIDSNGYIYFNGGTVVVDGPTNNGNGALDSGVSITQTGGTVIAVGASGMAETLGNTSSVNNASIYLSSAQTAGTTITIKNSAGDIIVNHTAAKAFNHIAVGTESFKTDETYTIYLNGAAYQSFTISGTTTTVGNSSSPAPTSPQNRGSVYSPRR